jgi:hypothetical protein
MKKIRISILAIALALSAVSCDFENENPNSLRLEDVDPGQLLTGAMTRAYYQRTIQMSEDGNYFMNYWYINPFGYGTAFFNTGSINMNITNSFGANVWNALYLQIYNFDQVINLSGENNDAHKAAALIMKSYYMQYIVDLYGDAPYSDALQGGSNISPAYDDDAAIYVALIQNVNDALVLLDNLDSSDINIGVQDVMFGGDIDQWKAFGNYVKVKLLLRESGVADATFLSEQFAQVNASGLFPTESVTINPGYNTSTDTQLNPYYSIFYNSAGTVTSVFQKDKPTGFFADILNGEQTEAGYLQSDVIDPRRSQLFTLIGGKVEGIKQGYLSPDLPGGNNFSDVLLVNAMDAPDSDGYVVTLAEVKFLLAEAIQKGYLTSFGDAQTAFNEGVQASFDLLGAGDATSYLTAIDTKENLGWNGGNSIAAIMAQKWIANYGFNLFEPYIDWVRTGFPRIPLSTTAIFPNRPYRFPYPQSEYSSNSANVPTLQQGDLFNASSQFNPFWKQ